MLCAEMRRLPGLLPFCSLLPLLSCAEVELGDELATEARVVLAPRPADGGVVRGGGCQNTATRKLLVFLEAARPPAFCAVLLLRPGSSDPQLFPGLIRPPEFLLLDARAGRNCESIEAPSGHLEVEGTVPVDDLRGQLEFRSFSRGLPLAFSVSDGGLRAGGIQYEIEGGLFSLNQDCLAP